MAQCPKRQPPVPFSTKKKKKEKPQCTVFVCASICLLVLLRSRTLSPCFRPVGNNYFARRPLYPRRPIYIPRYRRCARCFRNDFFNSISNLVSSVVMLNKKTLTLKTSKTLDDAPLTPVDQTLRTPLDPPNNHQASYFNLYNHPQYAELDDLLTDVDEPAGRSLKNYLLTFTPVFDQLVLAIYLDILLLPTTTPFLGSVPPLGLVSKVAHETMILLLRNASDQPVYDTQSVLSPDFLKNHAYQPIILQLIRKRFLDLCAAQKQPQLLSACTSVLVPAPNNVYAARGGQLSILNLLLNEQNVNSYLQQQPTLAAQAAALSRLRLSSLNLRKHSLTRNNSYNGSNWLHVGNLLNIRPNANLGMHADQNASTDSLQLMHDFVPRAFIQRNNLSLALLGQPQLQPAPGGFNAMMLDYQTPPSSSKSSFSLGSTPNNSYGSYGGNFQPTPGSAG